MIVEPGIPLALRLGADMKRREFITLVGGQLPRGLSPSWRNRVRVSGVLGYSARYPPTIQYGRSASRRSIRRSGSGWTIGRNIQIEYSVGQGSDAQLRRRAAEMVALAPEVILSNGTSAVQPMMDATRACRSCSST